MKILVVAGEASADLHLAEILAELRKTQDFSLIGIGGDRLQALGLNPLRTAREMAVVGLAEVIRRIPATLSLISNLASLAKSEKPDLAILCDLPDFNLRLAPKLKAAGIPVLYYVSPQVWAWRSGRVKLMAECIDLLLSIFPFELDWYRHNAPANLKVEFVGHPSVEEIPSLPYEPIHSHIALLPGSREGEIERLLPSILASACILKKQNPDWRFFLPLAEPLRKSNFAKEFFDKSGPLKMYWQELGDHIQIVEKPAHEVLRHSRLAIVASGTATLETGLVGVPMVVVYKVAPLSAFIFKNFVNYQGPIAMVNLIHCGVGSQERLVPELIQDKCQPENIANEVLRLNQEENWLRIKDQLAQTRTKLGGVELPVKTAAKRIAAFIRDKK